MDTPVQLTFQSPEFPPEAGEDTETNPGVYGKALSAWLAERLLQHGYRIKRTLQKTLDV